MSDLKLNAAGKSDKKFDPHPEGSCMAICRDIWVETKANPKFGQKNQWGNDEPKNLVKAVFEFLTEELIEIAPGDMRPRFVSRKLPYSWHEKSSLRAFVKSFDAKAAQQDTVDLSEFIGRGFYLTIAHNTSADGNVWANITNAAPPPKGAILPAIPADFVGHDEREKRAKEEADVKAAADSIRNDSGDEPF